MQHLRGAWSAWLLRSNHKDLRVNKKMYFMLVPRPKSFLFCMQNCRTTRFLKLPRILRVLSWVLR